MKNGRASLPRASATHADPGVLERLGGGDALGGVDGQHLVDEVFGFGGHRVPLRGRELLKQEFIKSVKIRFLPLNQGEPDVL